MTSKLTLIWRLVWLGVFVLGALAADASLYAAQTPSPALLITTKGIGEHALEIADPLTMKVVASVPIIGGGQPHEVAVSDDGRLAFVTSTLFLGPTDPIPIDPVSNPKHAPGDYISIIDLAKRKELRHVETGPGSWPHGIVSVDNKVYYTAQGYMLVGRYDLATNKIDLMLGTGQERMHEIIVTKNQVKIFTSNSVSDTVTFLEKAPPPASRRPGSPYERWNITNIPVGKGPEGMCLSPDGKTLWVTTYVDGGMSIIDVNTKKVLHTLKLNSPYPLRPAFTPDGKRVVIGSGTSGEVLIFDAATRAEIKRIRVGAKNPSEHTHDVLISPDGARAYVAVSGEKNVAVIDLKTLELVGHISTGTNPEGLAWVDER